MNFRTTVAIPILAALATSLPAFAGHQDTAEAYVADATILANAKSWDVEDTKTSGTFARWPFTSWTTMQTTSLLA